VVLVQAQASLRQRQSVVRGAQAPGSGVPPFWLGVQAVGVGAQSFLLRVRADLHLRARLRTRAAGAWHLALDASCFAGKAEWLAREAMWLAREEKSSAGEVLGLGA